MQTQLLSIREAGRALGYSGKTAGKTTMHKHCNEGRLQKIKIGGRSFVTIESVLALVVNSTVTPAGRAWHES